MIRAHRRTDKTTSSPFSEWSRTRLRAPCWRNACCRVSRGGEVRGDDEGACDEDLMIDDLLKNHAEDLENLSKNHNLLDELEAA
ncbi:hypothetical protein A0H81_13357 [Grifola frondosa]|uniref:Uncharacterized protein n=1 Tax=Grifola frondosa TaxID=5627 RepID=A0A1C7LQE3_GRIFR|nr:hypothetical protein A0H81_13357 [Grifola frondosa]